MQLFQQCVDGEFCCRDGKCIPIEKRCNGISDCNDNYDETNCEMVLIKKDLYRKEDAPYPANGNEMNVTINFEIISIGSFEELKMTFSMKFLIQIEW